MFSSFYIIILLINVILLSIGFLRSFKAIQKVQVKSLDHFLKSWLGLAFFWFGFVLLEVSNVYPPLYELEPLLMFNLIVIFIAPFMLEIFNFYLSLFSNRLNQFETYFPVLIAVTWGLSLGAIISEHELLLLIPMMLVLIISLFFMVYCIIIYIRSLSLMNNFGTESAEYQFLQAIRIIIIFTIIGGSYDAIWLPIAFIFPDLFYITSSIGFLILAGITVLFLLQVNQMIKTLPKIDISLILNELN